MVCKKVGHEALSPRSASSDKSTSASAELEAFSKPSTMRPLPLGWGCLKSPVEQLVEEFKQETSIDQHDAIEGDCLLPVGWGQHRTLKEELHRILASEASQEDAIEGDCLVPVGWGQHRTLKE